MPSSVFTTVGATLFGLGIALAATGAVAQPAPRTVVLVHGALADGSSWSKVIPLLQAKGLKIIAVQNPLTSLKDDVAATKRAIEASGGPVVLVGHSWGGVVITEAGTDPKVAALVYVAALAPGDGQSANDLLKGPPAPGFAEIHKDASGYLSITAKGVAEDFAQDLPAADTAVMAVTQGPINGTCFADKVSVAAWKSKPSWYIVAGQDRMIMPAAEMQMAQTMKAHVTTLPTSHVAMLSKPAEVAAVITEAAMAK